MPTCPPQPCGPTSKCDRYDPGNVWVEHGEGPFDCQTIGVCLLDTMSDDEIRYVIERNEAARQDLLAITTDDHILNIANTTPRLSEGDVEVGDELMRVFNKDSMVMYTHFGGQPPWNG